jgi:hypothetical protein
MRTVLTSLYLAIGLLCSSAPVLGEEVKQFPECSREPTQSDISAAKAAFQAGNASFDEADYPRAILYWEDAYRRDCTAHALLLNLARAYELNGQKQQAVVALETFLARQPDTTQKDQISRRVDVLNKQIEAERQNAAEGPSANTAAPATVNSEPASPSPGPVAAEQPAAAPGSGQRSIVPLIVAGAGVLVAGIGTWQYFDAKADVDDWKVTCGGTKRCPPALVDDANAASDRQQLWGGIALVGVGAIAGGLVWYFVQPTTPAAAARALPPRVQGHVSPTFGRGFGGVTVSGAF